MINASRVPSLQVFCCLFICFKTEKLFNILKIRQRMNQELLKRCRHGLKNDESEHFFNFVNDTKKYLNLEDCNKKEILHLINLNYKKRKLNNIKYL